MTKKRKTEQTVTVRIEVDGLKISAVSDKHSADIDRLLGQQGAESFVFIPLAIPGKRLRRSVNEAARKKPKLPAGDWYDGELQGQDDDNPVPGVLAFDIRRRKAREIAEKLGMKQFLWGTSGAPVELHTVKVFKNDNAHSWSAVRSAAFAGLSDMVLSARNMAALPTAVQESQTNMQKFWQLVAVVLGLAIAAGVLQAFAYALLDTEESTSWLALIIRVLFYPFVIPAVLVGVYLRVLARKAEEQGRDFTASEGEENWHKVSPHLLALWLLCWVAIVLLTWVQSVPSTDLPFLGRTSGVTTSFIVCVWMLLPIANSHNVESLFGPAFEAAIAAAVSIFTIKISLYVTNIISDIIWDVVLGLVPLEIPERLQEIISALINFGAEVFFVTVLLGYAWARTRKQFMRL